MRLTTILGAAVLGIAFAAPALADDITFAVVGPMTGQLATIGDQFKHGAEAAAAAINAKGGVDGPPDQARSKTTSAIRSRRCRSPTASSATASSSSTAMPARARASRPRPSMPRARRADDEPGLVQSAADRRRRQERLADDHAALYARRRAGRLHRPVDRREVQGQERRHPARQERLRPGRGRCRQGDDERGRPERGPLRGHQCRREGLFGAGDQAQGSQGRCRLFRRLSPGRRA